MTADFEKLTRLHLETVTQFLKTNNNQLDCNDVSKTKGYMK